ncbi:retron Ec78 anti-phage system effector HNH endonuclease PtuB [Kosakonia radicincitans]|uniref:retron Ec78 anti-phage system effector HNH endonuclease PtuB n=1 Tax=Kosakonia radicincitans TaxID=283686 RepID=UPI001D05F694|nr:retron Ec78 anti-phage system effector HNH endonuclease PtuB [Kosakonia radicincitans]
MHKLSRGIPPKSLALYNYKTQKWDDYILVEANKRDVWDGLFHMQGYRCAYCECELLTFYKGHVEHFVQKGRFPQYTFDWNNLFGSCRRSDGCGFYKDNQSYRQGDILKVDEDDPDDFFDFLSDGSIVVKDNLTISAAHRARETLRVFNLDAEHGALRQQRATAIKLYSHIINELNDYFEAYGADETFLELLDENLTGIEGVPFQTAIRHGFY